MFFCNRFKLSRGGNFKSQHKSQTKIKNSHLRCFGCFIIPNLTFCCGWLLLLFALVDKHKHLVKRCCDLKKRLKQIAHVWWFTVALEVSPQKHLFSPTSGNYLPIYHLSKEVYLPLIYTETVNGFESALWLASQTTNILCHLPKSNKRRICARKYFYCCRNKWVKTILVCYTISLFWSSLKRIFM